MTTLRLTLPYPPSDNEYWRSAPGKGMVPSQKAIEYKARVRSLMVGVRPLFGDVTMSGTVYRPRNSGDMPNRIGVLLDALEGIAYLDDKQVAWFERFGRASGVDAQNPRVELVFVGERFAEDWEVRAVAEKKRSANEKRRATLRANRAKKMMDKLGVKSAFARY